MTRLPRWIPALVYMGLIFYSSSQSDPAPILTRNVWDKLLHGGGYALLGLLYVFALSAEQLTVRSIALIATALASAYAASDEIHQMFTPGRMSDVHDWLADTIGAAAAAGAFALSTALRRRRPLPPSPPGRSDPQRGPGAP